MLSIHEWPVGEQPREKLLRQGPASLSDAELLAIFLRIGIPGKSAVDLARELLLKFGNLQKLLTADAKTLKTVKGLGNAKIAQLQASLEVGRRFLHASLEHTDVLTSTSETKRFIRAKLKHYQYEVFACLFLDNQHHIICFEEMFRGTVNAASVHPREVIKRGLHHNAAAIILAHNHPSGKSHPSAADRQITDTLSAALHPLDIQVLDHMVVGDTSTTSFAELGWL